MYPKYIYILIYLLSLSVGILNYKKIKGTKMMLFLYILSLGLIAETVGYYVGYYAKVRNTFPVYNIYELLSVSAYFFLFRSFINSKTKRRITLGLLVSIIVFGIFNFIFKYPSILTYQLDTWMYCAVCFIIVILMYLIDLFNMDTILKVKEVLLFWVAIGNLLFFIGFLPVFTLSTYFNYNGIWDYTVLSLNIMMSLFYITGFIFSKRKYNNPSFINNPDT